jgi:glutaredoxin
MITIYSKPNCPWCERAKTILTEQNLSYTELVLGSDYTRDELQELLPNVERLTVPQIFIEGDYIGTYEDLKLYLKV